MSENNQEKEIKDTKAIEEKALNYLKILHRRQQGYLAVH